MPAIFSAADITPPMLPVDTPMMPLFAAAMPSADMPR